MNNAALTCLWAKKPNRTMDMPVRRGFVLAGWRSYAAA